MLCRALCPLAEAGRGSWHPNSSAMSPTLHTSSDLPLFLPCKPEGQPGRQPSVPASHVPCSPNPLRPSGAPSSSEGCLTPQSFLTSLLLNYAGWAPRLRTISCSPRGWNGCPAASRDRPPLLGTQQVHSDCRSQWLSLQRQARDQARTEEADMRSVALVS